jgi:hypothetical protein
MWKDQDEDGEPEKNLSFKEQVLRPKTWLCSWWWWWRRRWWWLWKNQLTVQQWYSHNAARERSSFVVEWENSHSIQFIYSCICIRAIQKLSLLWVVIWLQKPSIWWIFLSPAQYYETDTSVIKFGTGRVRIEDREECTKPLCCWHLELFETQQN